MPNPRSSETRSLLGDRHFSDNAVIRPPGTTRVRERDYRRQLDRPKEDRIMAMPFGVVKFGLPRFLDLSLERCTLGTSVDGICTRFPPPSHLPPRGNSRGSFLMRKGLLTRTD